MVVVGCSGLLFVFFGCLRLGADARAVRDVVFETVSRDRSWHRRIELSIGVIPMFVARQVTSFVDIPDEARLCLRSARKLEVGVYEVRSAVDALGRAAMLREIDSLLNPRGWERVVAVVDGEEAVCVFVQGDGESASSLALCVIVLNGEELVIASGRVDPEPLIPFASEQIRRHRPAPRAVAMHFPG